ncbi:MAG: PAS domain S-box protein [Betaproteobacteria bacterium]|nr:PAS domain S-box protein [Betaproteobacteria bacterium]
MSGRSIRTLLFTLVAALVVPLAGIAIYSIYANVRKADVEAKSVARTLAAVTAYDTARTLKTNREALRVLAQRPLIRAVDADRCDPVLRELRPLFPGALSFAVFNRPGDLVCSATLPPGTTFSVAKTAWFRRMLRENREIVGEPLFGVEAGRWITVLANPIHGEGKNLVGVLTLPLDLAVYVPNMSAAPLPADTVVGILTADGTVVWRNTDPKEWLGKNVGEDAALKQLLAMKNGEMEGKEENSENRLYAITPIPGAEWYAYVGIPTRVIYADANSTATINSFIALFGLMAITGIAVLLSRRIEQPVRALVSTTHAIREGKTDTRAQASGVLEIADLAGEFNLMLDHLHESERRLRDVFESVHLLTLMLDAQGNITFCNQALLDLTGWKKEEVIGKNWFPIFRPPEQSQHQLQKFLMRIAAGTIPLHYEGDVVSRDGARFVIYWSHTLMRDLEGRVVGVASIGQDITQRKRAETAIEDLNLTLEHRVKERTAELDRANKELESFAYSISHDLRGPARAMSGFSSIVLEENKNKLDPESVRHLTRIEAAARHMGRLIDDLLRLSRISTAEMQRQEFDLSQMVRDIAQSLAEAHPRRKVRIEVEPDMRDNADPGLVRILLENALENAWKFTSRVEEARIEVGREKHGADAVYFVRDNGAGFDMQYASKLFAPFQRLHHQDAFEGTGIGLSIVHRIISRHKGRVWAEGKTGGGATIRFTLGTST